MTQGLSRRPKLILALLVLAGLAVGAASLPPVQRGVDALWLVYRLATVKAPTDVHGEPHLIDGANGAFLADLYRHGKPEAGLVLITGAQRDGRSQPQLIALAKALAEAGFAVLVPDVPGLRALRISSAQAEPIQEAVAHVTAKGGLPAGAPVGLAALSYSVGPAVLAAADLPAGQQPNFLLGIGGYYDSEAAITFFTTGYFYDRVADRWRGMPFNDYGKWVFVLSNAPFLDRIEDAALLKRIASLRGADEPVDLTPLIEGLSPDGRAVLRLAENRDPAKTPALIAALPASLQREIEALSLAERDLANLSTTLLLVHGHNDPILPASESVRLADAAPNSRLYLLNNLAHVALNLDSLADAWTLLRACYDLMAARDGVLRQEVGPTIP